MFGDPVTNPKGWAKEPLQELCSEIADCPHSTPKSEEQRKGYACIRSSDLQNGFIDWSTTKYVNEREYLERVRRLVPEPGDVIYCREGARFGNAGRIPDGTRICLGQRTMLFRCDPSKATSEFLWAALISKGIFHQTNLKVGGAASPHVNVKDIKNFTTVLPPLEYQMKYTNIVMIILKQRDKFHRLHHQSQQLFESLSTRAFRGEL